ncbi:MAG TPA: PilZ domain-containing protein [Terriglobales bacterium]|nr:PilZ domain-containing protein [Terriglobales bacterium]
MALECLVVVREPKLQKAFRGLLTGIGVQARVATDVEQAMQTMRDARLDAVIVDCCDFAEGPQLIRTMRHMPANTNAVAFAVMPQNSTSQACSETEAHFVLQQPLSIDVLTRTFRAARNLMLQEQRRFFRYPVQTPVTLSGNGGEIRGKCTTLSSGGLALQPLEALESTWSGKVMFDLPEQGGSVEARAEVAWMLPNKTAGLRFTSMSDNIRTQLEQWVAARVVEDEPSALAR